jgi:hypothetical protein
MLTLRSSVSLTLFAVFAAAMTVMPTEVMAQAVFAPPQSELETTFMQKVMAIYRTLRNIIYVVGAIGLIVMAVFAFFGKFQWKYFFALAGGMFLVAVTGLLIDFLGGDVTNIQP